MSTKNYLWLRHPQVRQAPPNIVVQNPEHTVVIINKMGFIQSIHQNGFHSLSSNNVFAPVESFLRNGLLKKRWEGVPEHCQV